MLLTRRNLRNSEYEALNKLEIGFGFVTFAMAILSSYLVHLSNLDQMRDFGYEPKDIIFRSVVFLVIPAMLVAVGAYIHSKKGSSFGMVLVLLFGGILVFLHLVAVLAGQTAGTHTSIQRAPGFLAFATIALASINTIIYRRNRIELE